MTKSFYYLSFCYFFILSSLAASMRLETVFGDYVIEHPLLIELIASKPIQRLKQIDQSGPVMQMGLVPRFSRYEHSIGVLALLIKAQSPLDEQVAGLLHDVSHTAFSHVGDHLFYKSNGDKSYQDLVHLDFLKKFEIEGITKKYGIELQQLDPDLPQYKALEQHLPDLCADRIQYTLHTGVILKKITSEEAKDLVEHLHFNGQDWYFDSIAHAKKFSEMTIYFTKNFWGSGWNFYVYEEFAKVLRIALDNKIITIEDIKYGTDDEVINKLSKSGHPIIKSVMSRLKNSVIDLELKSYDERAEYKVKPKFRGVDPLVQVNNELKYLTKIDTEYHYLYTKTREWCANGYSIYQPQVTAEYALVN